MTKMNRRTFMSIAGATACVAAGGTIFLLRNDGSVQAASNTLLWRLGSVNNASGEFSDYSAGQATYSVPADWSTRTNWSALPKGLKKDARPSLEISYSLSSLPTNGALFSFKLLHAYKGGPEMAVFSNGPLAGLIQLWGTGGTNVSHHWLKTYRLYIPKELLLVGTNTLRLEASIPSYYAASVNPNIWWEWDYMQIEALGDPATEPIHGTVAYLGTSLRKNTGFTVDQDIVNLAPIITKWMGIAYSGNTMRAEFWSDVSGSQPSRLQLLQTYRDLNLTVVADNLNTNTSSFYNADGTLTQQGKDTLNAFFSSYGSLFQWYEVDNEPGLFGRLKERNLEIAKYVNTIKPGHVKTTAPGWAFWGGTWEADPVQRLQVEAHCQVINGHSYGGSYSRDAGGGGSFTDNLVSYQGVSDGWPKEFINTEFGTNDWHSETNDGYGMQSSQSNASAFDRITRAHLAVTDRANQHAAFFDDYGMFVSPSDWSNTTSIVPWPGVNGQENRLKTWRRLALAYTTHGTPLTYTYLNSSAVNGKKVYFRAVDTSKLPALPGSGGTSNKVLLNFVNFEATQQTMQVRVTMPVSGSWAGERFGPGDTYADAHSEVSLNAGPTVDLTVTLGPRDSVQYILTPPTGGGGLPAPWQTQNIGFVGQAGSASYANGTFTVAGSGGDIWLTADGFRYVHQPLSGNGTIIARVASVQNTDPWAKAGVMIRETLDAGSKHALMAITPGNGAGFQRRTATNGSSESTAGPAVNAPYWVRLQRTGNTFTGSVSSDGTNWTQVGSTTVAMASSVYVGLAVTSHNNNTLNTSTFSNVTVSIGTLKAAINAGGAASGSFAADNGSSGGNAYSDTSQGISVVGVTNPAPQVVYQTCRWGTSFSYTIGGLAANASHTVRLHFADLTWGGTGQRTFNAAINGSNVLSNFDVAASSGGMRRAIVRDFVANANGSGQIVVAFSQGGADNPFVSGIEVYG